MPRVRSARMVPTRSGCDALCMSQTVDKPLASREKGVLAVAGGVSVMWAQEIADQALNANWDRFGIRPRNLDGLEGILASPFLHDGFGHLIANSVPLLVLGVTIALAGLSRLLAVTAIAALVGGVGTWLFAPANTNHIGASGIVFGFATYLLARGVFSRRLTHLAVGALVAFVYGGALLSGLIPTAGVSWQGHFFGGLGGVVAARALDRRSSGVARAQPA